MRFLRHHTLRAGQPPAASWLLALILLLIGVSLYDMFQSHHAVRRNYPLFGRSRWFMEWL